MSRFSRFIGKPKEITIEDEIFTIYPLKGKDIHFFISERSGPEEQQRISIEMIYLSLRPGEPDITHGEIGELPVNIFNALLTEITDLNGFGKQSDKVDLIKEHIKNARKNA